MPSGAAILCAIAVLLLSGYGRRVAASVGVAPAILAAWCFLAAGASVLNLSLPPLGSLTWQPLVNPGGVLVPMAFEAFLLFGPGGSRRPVAGACGPADGWALLAGALGGLTLVGAVAWGLSTGMAWPAFGFAVLIGIALGPGPMGSPRLAVLSGGAVVLSAVLGRAVLAAMGWSAWPGALGGGHAFDVAVWVLVVAGAVPHPALLLRSHPVRPVRDAVPQRR